MDYVHYPNFWTHCVILSNYAEILPMAVSPDANQLDFSNIGTFKLRYWVQSRSVLLLETQEANLPLQRGRVVMVDSLGMRIIATHLHINAYDIMFGRVDYIPPVTLPYFTTETLAIDSAILGERENTPAFRSMIDDIPEDMPILRIYIDPSSRPSAAPFRMTLQ
jgi:hypothetical protein